MPTYDHSITDFSRITDLLNVNFIPLKSVQFLPRLCAWISIAARQNDTVFTLVSACRSVHAAAGRLGLQIAA